MDFGLSEEQELLQETIRSFVRGECPEPRLREIFDSETGTEPALWQGLAEIGVAGLVVPEELGGAGFELLDLALVAEVLGEGAVPSPFLGHSLATLALARGGSETQRKRLGDLASGTALGSVALGEHGQRWLPEDWTVELRDGALHGTKQFVPHALGASGFVVGTAGGGLAWVERDAAGLRVEPADALDRTRPQASVHFDGAAAEALPDGAAIAQLVVDTGLVLLAADAFGAGQKLITMTRDHVAERKQFDTPLAQFQAVKHQLADLVTDLEPTRGLWWFAAHALDHRPDEASKAAALAKAHTTDCAMECARGAFELHGGIGFTWECDVQFWFKRVMFDRTWLGNPDLHHTRNAQMAGW